MSTEKIPLSRFFLRRKGAKKDPRVYLAIDDCKELYQVKQIQGGIFDDLTEKVRNREASFVETEDGIEITCKIEIPASAGIMRVNGTATISSREIANALRSLNKTKEENPREITLTVKCDTNVVSITGSCDGKIVLKPIYNIKKASERTAQTWTKHSQ